MNAHFETSVAYLKFDNRSIGKISYIGLGSAPAESFHTIKMANGELQNIKSKRVSGILEVMIKHEGKLLLKVSDIFNNMPN